MAPISLKIVLEDGAVTRTVKFHSTDTVQLAHKIVKEKVLNADDNKEYALFLRCTDDDLSGVWLENHRTLEYYMLRDGDSLDYLCKKRNLRVRLLDDTVKTLKVDQAKNIADLIQEICARIGISNWDEYGLCRNNEESEDSNQMKAGNTSTLRPKPNQKDRDVELEQLSKKLKTDDNVEWLDQYKTLREMAVGLHETLLLKRRLFYSDRNVDSRDPVQLNLLYVQTRDAILNGTHPVTEDQAAQFAGIQCQIHFGDFQEDKHKPGYIENLAEFLPEQYSSSWSIEKKIFKEHKKHQGLSPIEAKHFYTKTARELPTYGVTFFLVKEQLKGKKKLVPRLLGISSESILRLDETTKEILQAWPLTHVKTYHTGKSETFSLDFGDYSDKNYCVKTQDAHRIRDILEGYIDLIRKRMLAKHNVDSSESMAIGQEFVQGSRGNIIQHVANNPKKVVEQTFVGPNKILPFEKGDQISQGTQIVTMQQIIVSGQTKNTQQAVKGEIPVRSDMSRDCIKRLNVLNSSSVQIVKYLTDPNDTNLRDARRTLENMQADLPVVVDGIKKAAEKQKSEEAKKKLLDELQELEEYMKTLTDSMDPNNFDCTAAEEAAKRVADVTTLMYFSLDPGTRRRSDALRRSQKSFIADERTEATLHRASFLVAASTALNCVNNAGVTLGEPYPGEPLSQEEVEELQRVTRNNVAAINAAIALYLQAHADPSYIDYSAALASMNSLQELMPELAKNAQALGSVKSDEERNKFLDEIQELLDAARNVCTITGTGDHEKMQENSVKYADVASKLIFTLGRGSPRSKQDEIIDLAKQAGEKTSLLLTTVNELTCQAPDEPATKGVKTMADKTVHCARDLLACAHLTAPAIQEAHCRSALTASAEALSSSARRLASAWKPLVEHPTRQHLAKPLHQRTMDLAQALDRLTAAYANIGNDDAVFDEVLSPREIQRLQFIKSASGAKNNLKLAENELNKPLDSPPNAEEKSKIQDDLAKKIMQMNAAIASLIAATSDRSNPDYVTAELALNTITDLMPDVVKESKIVAAGEENADRDAILERVRALCEATHLMCANAGQLGGEDMKDAVSKFSNASGKLTYTLSPYYNPNEGQQIIDLASAACSKTTQLLANVQQISESVGGELGDQLDKRFAKTADAARALLQTAEVTARTISEPRCEAAFLSSVEALSSSSKDLAEKWSAVPLSPRRKEVDAELKQLEDILDQIRRVCGEIDVTSCGVDGVPAQGQRRLKFINTLSGVKGNMKSAGDELDKPLHGPQMTEEDLKAAKDRLSDKLAKLNAAIAALVAATTDRDNPDYVRAEEAITTINKLMPDIVKDTKLVGSNKNDAEKKALLDPIRALCEATHALCASAPDDQDLKGSVARLADVPRKLVFLKSTRSNPEKEKQVMDLSSLAVEKASHLLSNVQQLAEAVEGEAGQELVQKSVSMDDAAQALLTNAKLTAPTMSEPQCQAALVSSIDTLSASSTELGDCWRKLADKPYHGLQNSLEKDLQELDAVLKELKGACRVQPAGVDVAATSIPREQRRLKLINTLSGVKNNLKTAEDELNKPLPVSQMKKEDIGNAERRLSDKMAQLNAAIAALVAANADRENPDYMKAEEAVTTISRLMPDVVKESKTASCGKNEKDRAAMLDQIRALCDATQKLCASAGEDQGINESANELVQVSDKLKFVITPSVDAEKETQVLDLSSLACGKASVLLADVQQLVDAVGGEIGQELDQKGSKTADAAQALLCNARLTAATINEPKCQTALVSSIDALSSSSDELGKCWRKVQEKPYHGLQNTLEKDLEDLEAVLKELKGACKVRNSGVDVAATSIPQEQRRLKFINTLSGVNNNLKSAEDELNKPIPATQMKKEDIGNAERRLSDKMAQLNAAIVALVAANADREKPDYKKAEEAVATISRLMPDVVKESKAASCGKNEKDRAAMLDQIRKLCEATKKLCASAGEDKGLDESVNEFVKVSDKLKFVISPSVDAEKETQVLELSQLACGKASHLLADVQQLVQAVGGEIGQELDQKGAKTVDAAQALLCNARLTAATIDKPQCQATMLSTIDELSSSSDDLGRCWRKVQDKRYHGLQDSLEKDLQEFEAVLKELKGACKVPTSGLNVAATTVPREQHRLKFINTLSGVKNNLKTAEDELNKPLPVSQMKKEDIGNAERRLSDKMAQLNAAIAALVAANSDRENPDYKKAEEAVTTISRLMPDVVKESKAASCGKNEKDRTAMLDQIRELCETTQKLCASAGEDKGLDESVNEIVKVSDKLKFVISPTVNAEKETQVLELSQLACGKASHLLADVQQLVQAVGGEIGQELDQKGAKTVDAAQALLCNARLTAATIDKPQCQAAMLSTIDELSSSSDDLGRCWRKVQDKRYNGLQDSLEKDLQEFEAVLKELKGACKVPTSGLNVAATMVPREQHRLKFINTLSGVKNNLKTAEDELNKPLTVSKMKKEDIGNAERRLSDKMAQLNAAIAALVAANADRENPDYKKAEEAVTTISRLMPDVVKESKIVSSGKNKEDGAAMLDQIRALCDATQKICASAGDDQGISESADTFMRVSDNLKSVVSPSVDVEKQNQVLDLSTMACHKASVLLADAQQLVEAVGGERGQELDQKGSKTADAAQALLFNARLTAPTIAEPKCQTALVSSIDALSSSSNELGKCWRKIQEKPYHGLQNSLEKDLEELEAVLKELKSASKVQKSASMPVKPTVPVRKTTSTVVETQQTSHRPAPPPPIAGKPSVVQTKPKPPAPPRVSQSSMKSKNTDVTQQFLDRVRYEESQELMRPRSSSGQSQPSSPCARKTDDEKRMHQEFVQNVDDAKKKVKKTEDNLRQVYEAKTVAPSPLSANELLNKKQSMQEMLASVGVEVAALVSANYANKIDFETASKATNAIPELMSSIVEDGKIVSSTMKDQPRRAFLDDMLKLCESTNNLCDAAKSDREKLNEAAIKFGDNSRRILNTVSSEVDPALENEIIGRAKEIGDSASVIAREAAKIADNRDSSSSLENDRLRICQAGTKCIDAAGKLVYTAKLVSPSIHNPICQEALISSADTLSNHLKMFSNTWNPLSPDPVLAKSAQTFARETTNLEKLLESLRRDVKGGTIGRRREIQKLVIEDTPIRQLTMKIIDDAKYMAECPEVPFAQRSEYAAYADRLAEALREMDIANARCNRSPQDTNKRRDLENAIQELQMALLQTRPRLDGKPKDNIVDLRDFIQDVATEAKNMMTTASGCGLKENARGKKAIEDIVGACKKINEDAVKLMTGDQDGGENSFDDVQQVDDFGQGCEAKVKAINSSIQSIEDEKTKNMLQKKVLPLSEKCNLLMFATKSGLSTAQGVSLDETLNDLDDLENRVIKSFVDDAAKFAPLSKSDHSLPVPPKPWVKSQLCTAVVNAARRAHAQPVPHAFTAYIADAASSADLRQPHRRDNLLKHLYKVVHQLKELTVMTSKRLATWQPLDHPQVSNITEQILQEIDHPESNFGVPETKSNNNVVNVIDANKLLMPCDNIKVDGDAKQLKEKVQQLCTKLSITSNGVLQSVEKPESLSRSLHATVEGATQLRNYANALKNKQYDPTLAKKIEEAAQEMSLATYNLVKTSEHVSQTPNNTDRRRLLDALRQLNDSINKLVRATSPPGKVSQECEEQTRRLALATTALQGRPHSTCALPYADCVDALHSQSDVIQKLKSDQKMSREEFAENLNFVSSVVCNSADYATQCAYLLSVSEKDKEVAEIGLVDVSKLQKMTSSIQDTCMSIIRSASVDYAEGDKSKLEKQVGDLIQSINESTDKVKDPGLKGSLEQCKKDLNVSAIGVSRAFSDNDNKAKLNSSTMELLAAANRMSGLVEDPSLQPQTTSPSPQRQTWCDDIMNSSRALVTKTQALVKEVKSAPEPEDPEMMTWYSFNLSRKQVLDAFDALLKTVQTNGQRAGIIEGSPEEAVESDAPTKSYMQSQLDLTKKWLETPMCKANSKAQGQQAAQNIIDVANKMCEDMKPGEKDDMCQLILETKQLLNDCKSKYDNEKYSVLLDRIKELKKVVERGVVTRVVEDFIEGDEPLADLDIIADAEKDATARKYLLEKKIAELLAQLGRVTKTARIITDTGSADHTTAKELKHCSEQTELLAPMLVKAAQERITHPDNKVIIENYKSLLTKYAESMSRVRDLCDQAVDPMDFVQTAGETMQRMREESAKHNDPIKNVQTSQTITKLANRVMHVSMSSRLAKSDPELQKALMEARQRLRDTVPPPNTRASRLPDSRDIMSQILRTTVEVESALGGENIFKKQPEPDQPIYLVALDLHTSIKDWSSRDNEIVAVAKRTAVLMAKLSDYMNNDRKRELLATSKAIVSESHEVAYLARKLAHECTDLRIKTNLLKACERIPTISSQLKMLTTVKGSSLGHQGTEEDKEAMNMLVHNAQSLMMSIQEVVKAAASASVKIMSQHGPRIKWVRKNYY